MQEPAARLHQQYVDFHLPPDAWMDHLQDPGEPFMNKLDQGGIQYINQALFSDTHLDGHRYQMFLLRTADPF